MALFTVNSALAATSATFSDINSKTDYYDAIQWAVSEGIATGYDDNSWKPNVCVKRAELVKMVLRARSGDGRAPADENFQSPFPDIKKTDWYWVYANKAKSLGIVAGYNDGYFRGYLCVNRAEAMKIAVNAMFEKPKLEVAANDVYFDDKLVVDIKNNDWFAPYARFLFKDRLIGTNHTVSAGNTVGTVPVIAKIYFYPAGEMTRKEVAQMLYLISKSANWHKLKN
ncbi:S-layer homology domain-containing protein [Candidatus Peregrinibacteria bacterium]|nr:S-layer homology domain-containing protein [Candidatus Peregrinibacteria bacterium]